ncbi:hypothetical protein ACWDXD_21270, partial [Streptomyces sp. NPDC003314]
TFLTVPEERIRAAQRDLARRGLFVEATGTACSLGAGPSAVTGGQRRGTVMWYPASRSAGR